MQQTWMIQQTTDEQVFDAFDRILRRLDNPTPALLRAIAESQMTPQETYARFIGQPDYSTLCDDAVRHLDELFGESDAEAERRTR
jgi:hypothetical protein